MERFSDEISLERAAELLGVSRSYVHRLLDQGRLPYSEVAGEPCVRYADLVRYQQAYQREAVAALSEMTAEAQALGLYE